MDDRKSLGGFGWGTGMESVNLGCQIFTHVLLRSTDLIRFHTKETPLSSKDVEEKFLSWISPERYMEVVAWAVSWGVCANRHLFF